MQDDNISRKDSIRIYGLTEDDIPETTEKCITKVVELLNKKLGMNVTLKDISIAHRLGKTSGTVQANPRGVIVKFTSRIMKSEAIRQRKALKGTKIVIREDLTRRNQTLLKTAASHTKISSSWSHNGKIFVKSLDNRINQVTSPDDLDRLCKGYPSLALSTTGLRE